MKKYLGQEERKCLSVRSHVNWVRFPACHNALRRKLRRRKDVREREKREWWGTKERRTEKERGFAWVVYGGFTLVFGLGVFARVALGCSLSFSLPLFTLAQEVETLV